MSIPSLLRRHPRAVLALIALACLASVAGALIGQHRYDMQPCPWCVLQRIIYLAIAAVAGLAALMPTSGPAGATARLSRALSAGLVTLLALAGAAAALYQNLVAAHQPSCDLTLADRIISGLGLDAWQPEVFEVRSSCADAAVSLLGVPFELWSLALYGTIAVVVVLLMAPASEADNA